MFAKHIIDWDDDKVSRLWDYYSITPPYADIFFSKVFGKQLLNKTGLPLHESISVLDFGCGPGFVWDHLIASDIKWIYSGVDFSKDAVAILSKKAVGHKQFMGAHHVTRLPLNLPPNHFDAILLFEVIEHLNDNYFDETILEVSRLLKQGGMVIISTPNEENLADATKFCPDCGAIFHEWQHVRNWSVASLKSCMAKYGFRLVKAQKLDFSATGILRQLFTLSKKLLGIKNRQPHLIASFQKLSTLN
jgi:SAM-dependent methyltransferase